MEYRELFHLSFVSGDGHQVASAPDLLISEVKSRRYWDTAVIEPSQGNFRASTLSSTRATVLWSSASRDEASWDWFLVSGSTFGPSAVEINLGGQVLERWPDELFVSDALALRAIAHFLESGQQDPRQPWVRIDTFPRTTIWEGRQGRETWEKGHLPEPNIG